MPNIAPDSPGTIHVAVAAIIVGDQVLVARRPPDKHLGGLLEFPGGKVEPGESVRQALARELAEEVAITVDPALMRPLIRIPYDYGDKAVLLDVWRVSEFNGVPHGLEGQPVSWRTIAELQDDDFPAANQPIIRALQLPEQWLITGSCGTAGELEAMLLARLPRQEGCGLILRQPELPWATYLELANVALGVCQRYGIPLMLHGDPDLLASVPGAAGVHLSQRVLGQISGVASAKDQAFPRLKRPPGKWLGVSCHSPEEMASAIRIGADYVTLSPVRSTASHPLRTPLGWALFANWTEAVPLPVYALGGMETRDVEQSRHLGGQGIAGISHWLR